MVERAALIGSWTHSHEEDHDGVQVFRPSEVELPPSRGRTSLTLRPDSTASIGSPGPDDRGTSDGGTWDLAGDVLRVAAPSWSASYEVVAADKKHLELRPV